MEGGPALGASVALDGATASTVAGDGTFRLDGLAPGT